MEKLGSDELRLVGLDDDGDHLVLSGPRGETFRVTITDELRAAVRRDRPRLEQLRSQGPNVLSPREIQARVRSGSTAQQIADEAGITIEQVRRYEGPVLAERQFIAQQASGTRVGKDTGSPTLGDLVTDRLAARGVDTESLAWDAARPDGHGWIVEVAFEVGGQERLARWTFDPPARALHALEDEARWLSETEIVDEPIPRRHLSSVRSSVFDLEADGSIRPVLDAVDLDDRPTQDSPADEIPSPYDTTAALLDDLRGRRGVRQQLAESEDDDLFEGFGPQGDLLEPRSAPSPLDEAPGAHPGEKASDLHEARLYALPQTPTPSEPVVAQDEAAAPAEALLTPVTHESTVTLAPVEAEQDDTPSEDKAKPRSTRRTRSKVPSWDEIVFGGKPE